MRKKSLMTRIDKELAEFLDQIRLDLKRSHGLEVSRVKASHEIALALKQNPLKLEVNRKRKRFKFL